MPAALLQQDGYGPLSSQVHAHGQCVTITTKKITPTVIQIMCKHNKRGKLLESIETKLLESIDTKLLESIDTKLLLLKRNITWVEAYYCVP